MKIDSSLVGAVPTATSGSTPRAEKEVPQKNSSSTVSLSEASARIQAVEASAHESSGFNAAKVAAIRQAIAEGTFRINPNMIARKLLASAQDLAQSQGA
ncbi:MAG: flagellar biosynthesis anti-sigma factor FlgM [Methylophilales bacterium]|nr:flagellar biosynthesis anti-sigma factor FlgM [Methylophilales bacterium]